MSAGVSSAVEEEVSCFHSFRNTVTRESCRKLTDWNSASRYNGYSMSIDPDRSGRARAHPAFLTHSRTHANAIDPGVVQPRDRA